MTGVVTFLTHCTDLGFDNFIELLEGAHEIDQHFRTAPLAQNAPVILALLSVWNCTFLGAQSQAILPYDQSLHMLRAYLFFISICTKAIMLCLPILLDL